MEATTLLQKIRQRGFVIKAIGNVIYLAPKRLLNDRMLNFLKEHKEVILTALYQEQDEHKVSHLERKRALREGRLVVLRLILQRYLQSKQPSIAFGSADKIEEFSDGVLIQFNYDLEKAIDHFRSITSEPKIIDERCLCGYMPPFCACGPTAIA